MSSSSSHHHHHLITYTPVYAKYCALQEEARRSKVRVFTRTIDMYTRTAHSTHAEPTGFDRLDLCRKALEALDRRGWDRSFHQRLFHDNFLRACARIFWKASKPGEFERCHEKILESNGWDSLRQEILVSTPRRFGKTISVSMFAAAMLYSAPKMEMSIYSTCKRISQKLLLNIQKFFALIELEMGTKPMKVIRMNMEEMVLQVYFSNFLQCKMASNNLSNKKTEPRGRAGLPDRELVPVQGNISTNAHTA